MQAQSFEAAPTAPRLSVVMPMYNAARTLERALRSVAIQDHPPHEVVVVDDGSRDDTLAVAERCQSFLPTLRIVRHPQNRGASEAYNTGIREARGDLIAFLDADDEFLPGKLSSQLRAWVATPGVVLATHDIETVTFDGRTTRFFEQISPVEGRDGWRALLEANFIATLTVMARRDDLLAVGGFVPGIVVGEDLDLWIKVAERGHLLVQRDVLARVYRTEGSVQHRHPDGDARWTLPMIEGHLARLAPRLQHGDAERIIGRRSFHIGGDFRTMGRHREAARYFARAARNGHLPVRSAVLAAVSWAQSLLPRRDGAA